jgi:hypothetical protein
MEGETMGNYLSPEQSADKRHARMDDATRQFPDAAMIAAACGLRLVRKTEVHYQLSPVDESPSWLLNIYPSNRRLYHDTNKPRTAPFLRLPDKWDLLDVVRAARKQIGAREL